MPYYLLDLHLVLLLCFSDNSIEHFVDIGHDILSTIISLDDSTFHELMVDIITHLTEPDFNIIISRHDIY